MEQRVRTSRILSCVALAFILWPLCANQFAWAEEAEGPQKASGGVEGSRMIQVFAPEDKDAQVLVGSGQRGGNSPSALSMVARTGFWLGLIIVMLCGVVALGRKFLARPMGMFKSPAVELLGRSYLDARRCVYLLKVGGRILVVGSSESGLSCLSEMTEAEEVGRLVALAQSKASKAEAEHSGFARALTRRVSLLCASRADRTPDLDDPRDIEVRGDDSRCGAVAIGLGAEHPEGVRRSDQCSDAAFTELRTKVEGLKARLRAIS